jgi:hypothetical protein
MDGTQSLSKLRNHTGRPFPLGGLFFRHVRHSSAGASALVEPCILGSAAIHHGYLIRGRSMRSACARLRLSRYPQVRRRPEGQNAIMEIDWGFCRRLAARVAARIAKRGWLSSLSYSTSRTAISRSTTTTTIPKVDRAKPGFGKPGFSAREQKVESHLSTSSHPWGAPLA